MRPGKAPSVGAYAVVVDALGSRADQLRPRPRSGRDWTTIGAVLRDHEAGDVLAATVAMVRAVVAGADPLAAVAGWQAVAWADQPANAAGAVARWHEVGAELAHVDARRFDQLLAIASRIVGAPVTRGAPRVGDWRQVGLRLATIDADRFARLLAIAGEVTSAYAERTTEIGRAVAAAYGRPSTAHPTEIDAVGWPTAEAAAVGAMALRGGAGTFAGWGYTLKARA